MRQFKFRNHRLKFRLYQFKFRTGDHIQVFAFGDSREKMIRSYKTKILNNYLEYRRKIF